VLLDAVADTVIVPETEAPLTGLVIETVGGGGAVTVSVNVEVWDRELDAPVTVMVDDPAGVDADVVRVNVDEHIGLHDPGEKAAVAPVGRPEAEKDTGCEVPETRVAVIVLDTDCP